MCGTREGASFDGVSCNLVFCSCTGEDCDDIEATVEDCEARFAACMDRTPQCAPTLLPTVSTDPGFVPDYPAYGFAVEGYDSLYDPQSQSAAVFADWTRAVWLGWEEPADADFCPGVPPARYLPNCPAPRPLVLEVDGEVVRLDVTIHWDPAVEVTTTPAEVDVRISPHETGTMVLEVKDAATELPVLMVVTSLPEASGAEGGWELAPFSFTPGEVMCTNSPDSCNWTFSGVQLDVTTDEAQVSLNPLGYARMSAGGADYGVFYDYILKPDTVTGVACPGEFSWHQNFAIVQIPKEE